MQEFPASRLIPPAAVVSDIIGNLLVELRIARRVLALARLAEGQQPTPLQNCPNPGPPGTAPNGGAA